MASEVKPLKRIEFQERLEADSAALWVATTQIFVIYEKIVSEISFSRLLELFKSGDTQTDEYKRLFNYMVSETDVMPKFTNFVLTIHSQI